MDKEQQPTIQICCRVLVPLGRFVVHRPFGTYRGFQGLNLLILLRDPKCRTPSMGITACWTIPGETYICNHTVSPNDAPGIPSLRSLFLSFLLRVFTTGQCNARERKALNRLYSSEKSRSIDRKTLNPGQAVEKRFFPPWHYETARGSCTSASVRAVWSQTAPTSLKPCCILIM